MSVPEVISFVNQEALACGAAQECLHLLHEAEGRRPFVIALSGGRVAGLFFQQLAQQASRARYSFAGVHFFWADERCVGPDDPESNFALAWKCLLGPAGVPAAQIHRIQGERDPTEAARRASDELRGVAGAEGDALPRADLILLGMGEDGHVASLFPGELEARMESPDVYRAVVGPKPPPRRVTLGYGVIREARHVWVLASGPGKAAVFRESLAPNGSTPLARVLRGRRSTRILIDFSQEPEGVSPS